ncbi:transport and Golgi organization protein 1 homolog [Stegodyphus dumicola]|uniref:transport and Golgi organization protein 1 homolog n=1 Tax=Stegodyphus dumicola TaxID=202533 RepID=UPI0015AA24EB|nr:transport and Golgi organization protein 1 homolog [Stegodyphus dumicola]
MQQRQSQAVVVAPPLLLSPLQPLLTPKSVACIWETNSELEIKSEEIEELKQREKEYLSVLSGDEKEKADLLKEKDQMKKKIKDQDECISRLNDLLQENENEMDALRKENAEYLVAKEEYEEKLVVLQQNCNQLLQEAEVWNLRVNELTMQLNDENTAKKELEESFKAKEEEVESLKQLVQLSEILSGSEENENKDAEGVKFNGSPGSQKSEIDKLKVSYNQALQDKAEAQTKLDVLTNYFKDKEIQLQKQLGVEEAVRQKKEEDASSAERRILLIEQENASYKYQVASMKQEMEETERNLKSQIAAQEKKAHENWIAARAAERKLEDVKQEVLQLRQRLTLLERDQENWVNSSRDNIIRPVPKRMPGLNDDLASSQEINSSLEMRPNLFPPPVPPPMLLPPDRPLPPLPPPPLPPFLPPLDPPFRPQPWHMPPPDTLSNSDFRVTPPEFSSRGRESTPPRGRRSAAVDGEMRPHASSPLGTDTRDSRNSTPPHSLPDFHDIPPQPPRPFFPPPAHHPRFSMPPPSFRRDPGPRRTDYQGNNSMQQPLVPQERWPHSNSRV